MRGDQEGYPGNNQSRNSAFPRVNEEFITEVSEGKGRVRKKLSQEFSRTESQNLAALYKLDDFLLNPHVRVQSRTVPRTSRNKNVENQEPAQDRSQNDPRPEVDASVHRPTQPMDSNSKDTSYCYIQSFT